VRPYKTGLSRKIRNAGAAPRPGLPLTFSRPTSATSSRPAVSSSGPVSAWPWPFCGFCAWCPPICTCGSGRRPTCGSHGSDAEDRRIPPRSGPMPAPPAPGLGPPSAKLSAAACSPDHPQINSAGATLTRNWSGGPHPAPPASGPFTHKKTPAATGETLNFPKKLPETGRPAPIVSEQPAGSS
jgi:hypothetical protein